jgi:hypothetical protein
VPLSETLDLEQVVIEAWLKVLDRSVAQSIMEKAGAFGLQITDAGYLRFYIVDSTAMRGRRPYIEAPFTILDRFVHVVAAYDGSFLRLIVDGEEVATDSHVGAIHQNANGLYIGNDSGGTTPVQGVIDELRISNAVHPLSVRASGQWVSGVISPVGGYARHAELEFEHALNGGDIFYDLLDESGKSLVGHTHIVSSPHDIAEIIDPFKVRVSLVRGMETDVSPQVDSIRATAYCCTYLPIVVKSVYDD